MGRAAPIKRAWVRSTLFNIAFIATNAVCCFALLPSLLLPRRAYLVVIQGYHYLLYTLEYFILGLDYQVRGLEHMPRDGAFLVAAKHMSTYETFKLRLLFNDPAIVLKKELLQIPLWGYFLKKSDVIAIDRSTPALAKQSINDGVLRIKEQLRPIIIFPQGTRVWPHESVSDKPYKNGIYRMQEISNLPVIPMATNSGIFWPRSGWLKSSGRVVFEFLPAISPGLPRDQFMDTMSSALEEQSISLMNEAKMEATNKKRSPLWIIVFLAILFGGYSYLWSETAKQVEAGYIEFMTDLKRSTDIAAPEISGFPGPIRLDVLQEHIKTQDGELDIKVLHARGWPIPYTPISIVTGPIEVQSIDWPYAVTFDGLQAEIKPYKDGIHILQSALTQGDFIARISGEVDLTQEPVPKLDLMVEMENQQMFLMQLATKKIIKMQAALFMSAGFKALTDEDGVVRVPITQRGQTLYAGPLPISQLPALQQQEEYPPELPRLEPYNRLGPDQ